MTGRLLEELLAGALPDPDGGPPLSVPTERVVIAKSLLGDEAELVRSLDLGSSFAVVSDSNTHRVLGARVERAMDSLGKVIRLKLEGEPQADEATVARVRRETAAADALLAVGSGTLNDICKAAAAEEAKPYAVFATAPSMNGYTSLNAAITVAGHKKSLSAAAPRGVFLDLEVLAAAPKRMIRSGLGDSLCRPTAQADWLLSHLLLGTAYRTAPFALLAEDEAQLLAMPEALVAGDLDAVACLARTLVLSGFGMTLSGGSHPASQGEHLISHTIEMLHPPGWPGAFHGEQIGVTTLTMARLQARLLARERPRLRAGGIARGELIAYFGSSLGASCWREVSAKRLSEARADELNQRLAAHWDDIRSNILAILRPARELESVLRRAGAPTTPTGIGLDPQFYSTAVQHARDIRNRYTFLDLAADCGTLDPAELH